MKTRSATVFVGTGDKLKSIRSDIIEIAEKIFNVKPSDVEVCALITNRDIPIGFIFALKYSEPLSLPTPFVALIYDNHVYPDVGLAIESIYPELEAAAGLGIPLPPRLQNLLKKLREILKYAPPLMKQYLSTLVRDIEEEWREKLSSGELSKEDIVFELNKISPPPEIDKIIDEAYELSLALGE